MIKIKTLSNGLRVVTEQMEGVRSVSVGVWVNAGSVFEDENNSGISHFIEHMLFKGTERRSATDIAVEMDSIGGNLNAFTAKECTCFYAKVMDRHIGQAVDILADLLLESKFEEEATEREKGVVCEEIYMTFDNPEDLVFEMGSALFFENSSLMRPILGTEETIRSFDKAKMREYMATHYTAENMVVCCTGSFDEQEFERLIDESFGKVASGSRKAAAEHKPERGMRVGFAEKDNEQVHICMTFPGYPLGSREYYALAVLSNVIGGSMSSRMFQRIREQMGLAYSVYTYPMAYRGIGCMCAYAGSGDKQAVKVLKLMIEELEKVIDNGISEEELHRCKEQLKGSYVLGFESTSSHMNAIGKCLLLQDKEYSFEATLSAIDCVTMEQTEAVAHEVLNPDRLSFSAVGRVGAIEGDMRAAMEAFWEKHGQA
ncbi:MAG TPA: pitrilysin family protein [Eubacteriales bacterium]|nr:pitrilysin family protein [Clostridia bacterium]HRV72287.1 pitrilysin family protein [Eubacteriales bacterium]